MDYKWAREFALKLINQYSIAGAEIPASYNNQSDYLLRIPGLLDDGQMYIATNQGRIRATVPLGDLESRDVGGWVEYTLPKDCWQVCSSGLVCLLYGRFQRYHKYHLVGSDRILVPVGLGEDVMLEYFRYPKLLGNDPADNAQLDNTPVAQMALPYYAAAHLVMYDNAFAYQALYNEFEAKMIRLAGAPGAEVEQVEDSYSAAEWRYNEA